MFKEPELKPGQPLTPIQHPKQSLGPTASRARHIMMAVVILAASGMLYYLKVEGDRQTAERAQMKAQAEKVRAEKNAVLLQTIPAANKGESRNPTQWALVQRVGTALAQKTDARQLNVKWNFHLLAEENALNVYALSSGDVYVTTALVNRMKTEGELAAAMAHAVAHAMAFNTPEPMPNAPADAPQWSYAIEEEAAADVLGLKLMTQAGYDPTAMITMFTVFADGYNKGADVAFFITHPNDQERLNRVAETIKKMYPQGIPVVLSK